ncbi:Uncharacterized protein Adt_14500 [Abeliophyllum distichum]|uniref:Uncharacterized protein n=1 Tax=Abeliophyllum distichum TaxID=126358 RepID=A0ABD1U0K1_9LAMI
MVSRTRPGKKKRIVATSCEMTTVVPSSKASCKGSFSWTTPQAKISTSLSQTTNVHVPTPLPQPLKLMSHYLNLRLRLRLYLSRCHHMKRHWILTSEVLGKYRGYIRGLGHGPKPAARHSVDLTSPNTESIALREQIEKQKQELVDTHTRLSQFESLIQKIVSAQVGMSSLAPREEPIFNMPPAC